MSGLCLGLRLACVSTDSQAEPQTRGVLPDPEICRAMHTASASYVDCLVERPLGCRHAFHFRFGVFCQHPQRDEIIRRTTARAPSS